MSVRRVPFSILDLSPIVEGGTAGQALRNSLDLARHAEKWGYHRYWVAEHHNMPGIASAAPAVVLSYLGAGTQTIRLGSGGVMLPNHAPLVIAEQFGTLASLYPNRIDLGLGRAPGTDPVTSRVLRRDRINASDTFPEDVAELRHFFETPQPEQPIRAIPGAGLRVPLWLLGSSLYSAQLAAVLGLPFAFASHFAPDQLMDALDIYRREFVPSDTLREPYTMAAISVIAADTDAGAQFLFTSLQQQVLNLRKGHPRPVQPPVAKMEWNEVEKSVVDHALREAVVGAPASVERGLRDFLRRTQAEELMVTAQIYDHAARLHSFELVAAIQQRLSL